MELIRDTNLVVTKALPAAGATNYTDAIDLGDQAPGISRDDFQLEVAIPALPSLADTKTYKATIQDSADGSSFDDVAALGIITLTGVSASGAAAKTQIFPLPKDLRRYVRVKNVVEGSGGNNTAVSVTLSVVR